jgi:hypothetical protein
VDEYKRSVKREGIMGLLPLGIPSLGETREKHEWHKYGQGVPVVV